ncbi:hypothetical protein F511_21742 [Dorcoceras hygrometricum]|uniref:Uncharacterized protein n=1 Tax=Dorcoceras hygrometricum TaxID=472368 RepID=A0A2Z7BJK9_9LAMI|nr:hypothetical protein F511_21742 [Dorcoceras hygrometricum]
MNFDPADGACVYLRNLALIPCCDARTQRGHENWAGSYSDQQEDSADEKRCARYDMSCDDISLDVITISSWLSADEAKRERRSDVVLRFSRWISADDVISDRFALALKIQQILFAMRKFSRDFSQEKPAGSNSMQSRAIIYQLLLRIQSQEFQAQRIEEVEKRSSRCVESAAKQLTTYEELSKMNVNC